MVIFQNLLCIEPDVDGNRSKIVGGLFCGTISILMFVRRDDMATHTSFSYGKVYATQPNDDTSQTLLT